MGTPLEIHKPKATHTLRDFLIELLTIVTGIFIAISLEQAVESIHWHHKAAAARESLRDELRSASGFYAFRVAASECVAQRLTQLNQIVESVADKQDTRPVGDLTLHLGQLLSDDAWQSEKAAGAAAHLTRAELQDYSHLYAQQSDMRVWMNQETYAWAALRVLEGNPGRLATTDVTLVRQNLQVARSLNFLIVVNAKDQLALISKLGAQPETVDAARVATACAPLKREPPSLPFTRF